MSSIAATGQRIPKRWAMPASRAELSMAKNRSGCAPFPEMFLAFWTCPWVASL
jgi:hypothetical protein